MKPTPQAQALRLLDKRLRDCMALGLTAAEAYDSFYQEEVADALAEPSQQPTQEVAGLREALNELIAHARDVAGTVMPIQHAAKLDALSAACRHAEAALAAPTGAAVPQVTAENERLGLYDEPTVNAAFHTAFSEHERLTGHKPSHLDVWLMAKGVMGADGKATQPADAVQALDPNDPLWDHKGNVRHEAVDRLRARQAAAVQAERELLRAGQAAEVMPMIGPLLDAWEGVDPDTIALIQDNAPDLAERLYEINRAMEHAATSQPTDEPQAAVSFPFRSRVGGQKLTRPGHASGLLNAMAKHMRKTEVGDYGTLELVAAYCDALEASAAQPVTPQGAQAESATVVKRALVAKIDGLKLALLSGIDLLQGAQADRDAERWRAVERAGGDLTLTLTLHNSRPDQRASVIDAAIAKGRTMSDHPQQTDRELLELAAKATGYVVQEHMPEGAWVYDPTAPLNADGEQPLFLWRPRHRDGDALRLAVKLELEVRNFNGKSHAGRQDKFWCSEVWFSSGDPYTTTRRAIVRAAAEIGKAMP